MRKEFKCWCLEMTGAILLGIAVPLRFVPGWQGIQFQEGSHSRDRTLLLYPSTPEPKKAMFLHHLKCEGSTLQISWFLDVTRNQQISKPNCDAKFSQRHVWNPLLRRQKIWIGSVYLLLDKSQKGRHKLSNCASFDSLNRIRPKVWCQSSKFLLCMQDTQSF